MKNKILTMHVEQRIGKKRITKNVLRFDEFEEWTIENGEIVVKMPDGYVGIGFTTMTEEKHAEYTYAANNFEVTEKTSKIISRIDETEETVITVSTKNDMLVHIRPVKPVKATV